MKRTAVFLVLALSILFLTNPVSAQDEKELGWSFEAEFASVSSQGNSESNTFGLSALLRYDWPRSGVQFEGGGLRTESSVIRRFGVGTSQDDFVAEEETFTEKTAENYYARGRYDYSVSDRFFLLGGVDWLRNIFSGIDSRFLIGAGAGNTWANSEKVKFSTSYSATYTFEEEVVNNPLTNSNFPGLRLAYDFKWLMGEAVTFTSVTRFDWNLDNTDDTRVDMTNALPIQISSKLAFKPSNQLLWRNDPALVEVPLFDAGGTDTGTTVFTPLGKIDSFWRLALVVTI
jgi:putative salt-induced outer membrane protein YdiY